MELTHASFFSGVGGLDMGLERAGWRTISFSEIDPYASAVLAERWPGVPNLGDILNIGQPRKGMELPAAGSEPSRWHTATLWSGGFPCQDLSVAGKRAGFAGARSSLAFAFLDLVERHRPPAVLLENVPGLLSSHGGRDFGTLLGTLAELRYGWAYRILDARHFGVPQRRRRVFIVALDLERGLTADRAAEVLSVGTRCPRHPATGHATGAGAAEGTSDGSDIVGTIPAGLGHHGQSGSSSQAVSSGHVVTDSVSAAVTAKWAKGSGGPAGAEESNLTIVAAILANGGRLGHGDKDEHITISPPPDPGGVRAPDGLAGRVDDRTVVNALAPVGGGPDDNDAQGGHLVAYTKSRRAQTDTDDETWVDGEVMPTLNAFDTGDTRTTAAILGGTPEDDPLLPLGLDSHRYRCCGNGVVSSVAEWVGLGLAAVFA